MAFSYGNRKEEISTNFFYIVNHEHITAKELADYFNVSTRTIYRYINTLSIAGIPIISTKGTGGGISLIDGHALDKSLLSKEEQQNIYQGLQMLQVIKYPNAEIALSKISDIFRNVLEPKWLKVDFTFWQSDENKINKRFSELMLELNKSNNFRIFDNFEDAKNYILNLK
ncbi:HTH domain-containing protein [Clostridioides sp. ZZV14-6044]|uniref:helix-turn-helix transcriptional regulator n=1 Tax=unclassified Clostridioides TaxID=2635829 RepID=UPI001D100C0A